MDEFVQRFAVNISRGGVFIRTREPKEVGTNTMEPFRTTPFFEEGRVYVRTLRAVFCFGI